MVERNKEKINMTTKERIRVLEEQIAQQEAKLKQDGLDLAQSFTPDGLMPEIPSFGKPKTINYNKFFKDDTVKLGLKVALGFIVVRLVLGKKKSLLKPIYSVGNYLIDNFKPSQALKIATIATEVTATIFSKKKKKKYSQKKIEKITNVPKNVKEVNGEIIQPS